MWFCRQIGIAVMPPKPHGADLVHIAKIIVWAGSPRPKRLENRKSRIDDKRQTWDWAQNRPEKL